MTHRADAPHGVNPERRQSTTQQRHNWSPACSPGAYTRVSLNGEGRVLVDKRIVDAVDALDACLAAFDYRTRRDDTGAYNCRPITGGSAYSLHAYGIAIDINWQSNPYGPTLVTDMPRAMVDQILAIRTNNGQRVWEWGGDWSRNKDAMHYEIDCTPADLATGLDPATLPGGTPPDEGATFMAALTPEQQQDLYDKVQENHLRLIELQEEVVGKRDSAGLSRMDRLSALISRLAGKG